MKKFFLLSIMVFALMFSGCSGDNLAIFKKSIAESRDSYYIYKTDKHLLTFVSGMREEPYESDGTVGEMVEFGILSYTPSQPINYATIHYFVVIDNIEYEGVLEKSDFNASFVVDLEKRVDNNASISVRLFEEDFEMQGNLTCASKDFTITPDQALATAYSSLSSEIKQHIRKDKLQGEVYLKIWQDYTTDNAYFWYVGVVCGDDTFGVLISAYSGEVLSIKK